MKTARTISCLTLLCISMAVQVSAQVNTASLTGLVTDSAGAVVPNASVKVKNKATDVESSATTDSSGKFAQNFSWPVAAGQVNKEYSICAARATDGNIVSHRDDGPFTVLAASPPVIRPAPHPSSRATSSPRSR